MTDAASTAPSDRSRDDGAAAAVAAARAGDRRGHAVHLALAALYALTLPIQTAPKEIAFGAVLACAVIRLGETRRTYAALWNDRVGLLLVAWAAWTTLSLAWSPQPEHGLAELKVMRFLLTAFALWPVLESAGVLVGAFLAGVLVQNGLQLAQAREWFGLVPDMNARLGGITHPIVTGVLCAMAVCWHLAAVLTRRGAVRWVCLGAMLAAAAGLVFTGSRGPWIAAAVSVPATLGWTAFRSRSARRPALIIAVLMVVAAAAAWPVAGGVVTSRVRQTLEDLRAADDGAYATDVGFRLLSWRIGWDAFRDAPLHGVGVGSFSVDLEGGPYDAGHAHSVYVHVAACTGAIGLGLFLAVVGLNLRRALVTRSDHPWAEGTAFALLAWLVAAAFDTFHVGGQMFAVLLFLVTLVVPYRPASRPLARTRP